MVFCWRNKLNITTEQWEITLSCVQYKQFSEIIIQIPIIIIESWHDYNIDISLPVPVCVYLYLFKNRKYQKNDKISLATFLMSRMLKYFGKCNKPDISKVVLPLLLSTGWYNVNSVFPNLASFKYSGQK